MLLQELAYCSRDMCSIPRFQRLYKILNMAVNLLFKLNFVITKKIYQSCVFDENREQYVSHANCWGRVINQT